MHKFKLQEMHMIYAFIHILYVAIALFVRFRDQRFNSFAQFLLHKFKLQQMHRFMRLFTIYMSR